MASLPYDSDNDDDNRRPEAKLEEVREELERVAAHDVPISEDFQRILAKLDRTQEEDS